ncbi:MAG: preprotein translocase subunit YajC [Rhodobacter sp.]|nr:preprotein translocase subunit YajC [Rhodobacter sp.]
MFITPAYAQAAGAAGGSAALIQNLIPFVLIFGIMWFLLIRPQQKKMKEHRSMVDNLRRGDQIVTAGGIIGKVSKVKEDGEIEVEIADGIKVRVVRATITNVLSKTEPASAE